MQETAHFEPGQQLPAVPAVALRRAERTDATRAERQPSGVSARGAGRVPAAEENWSGCGGGPLQHATHGSQRTIVADGQRADLSVAAS